MLIPFWLSQLLSYAMHGLIHLGHAYSPYTNLELATATTPSKEVFGMSKDTTPESAEPEAKSAAQKRALDSLAKRCRNLLLDPRAKVQPGQGIGVTLDPEEKDAFESLKEFTDAFTKLCLDNGMRFVTFIDYPANIWDKKKSGEVWSVIIKLAPVHAKSEPKVD